MLKKRPIKAGASPSSRSIGGDITSFLKSVGTSKLPSASGKLRRTTGGTASKAIYQHRP